MTFQEKEEWVDNFLESKLVNLAFANIKRKGMKTLYPDEVTMEELLLECHNISKKLHKRTLK